MLRRQSINNPDADGKTARQAAESLSLEQAYARLPKTEKWLQRILLRLELLLPQGRPLRVLDVGSAQGRALIVLARMGHIPYGVEPCNAAREVAQQLATQEGIEITLLDGVAEKIPYDNDLFDLVLATSVMEHVADLRCSLKEIHRVLRPGGIFWFNSASSLSPRQKEIAGFPFFGWYPDQLKRTVMLWAKTHRPELIGYTEHPAMNWWTPWKASKLLSEAGFVRYWNRWEIRLPAEASSKMEKWALDLLRKRKLAQLVADVVVSECSFAALKGKKD